MNEQQRAVRVFPRHPMKIAMLLAFSAACSLLQDEADDLSGGSASSALTGEVSLFDSSAAPAVAADNDSSAVELGVRFRADSAGTVNAIRFLKASTNTGTHTGHLWTNAGTLLGSVTFTSESASGWQTARFAAPVAIQPNVTYVASYHTDVGHYAATNDAFAARGVDRPPLHVLRDGQDGANGVYRYGGSAFPDASYRSTNYFVDVLFQPSATTTPPSCAKTPIANVTASGDDGNLPANVLDGNLATRWSSFGKGTTITADLGSVKSVCSVAIAWYNGDQRRATFQVMLSTDGTNFAQAYSGQSSGTSTALESVPLGPVSARYVRIVGNGNTVNDWTSITELSVSAGGSTPTDAGAPTDSGTKPDAGPTDSGSATDTGTPMDGGSAIDSGTPPAGCNLNATTSTFAAQFSAAQPGQVLCLASGSYGVWRGGVKSGMVTVRPQTGASVTMELDFNGASNIRIEGVTIADARFVNTTKNITVMSCRFTGHAVIDGVANANILFDRNQHVGIMTCPTCEAAMVHLSYSSATHSGVTIQNSLFADGNSDGIQTGTGVNIINNEFRGIHETGPNDPAHSDPIQLMGATGALVRGNYIHDCADGIVAYDGVDHVTIEDNVVNLVSGRWGIELYSDNGSIVRHNTLRYATTCEYAPCGFIRLDRKSTSPVGQGTVIVDNVATVITLESGSTAAQIRSNMLRQSPGTADFLGTPVYVGGAAPTTWAGFKLAPGSPGKGGASDGLDVGIR